MSLLLLTGAAGAFVGAGGVPAAGVFAATMLGLALACGGASALNHYLDRDIDKLMGARTATPPGRRRAASPAEHALEFGIALTAASFVLLDSLVNFPTALLALAGGLFYVFVYTRLLKRSTPQNIVIGGAAGAVPPLVGYASATGHLGWAALVMFGIVFLWTPPHFWALALMIKEHYANARVPMLPVVRGDRETARQIVLVLGRRSSSGTLVPVAFGDLRPRVRRRRRRARRAPPLVVDRALARDDAPAARRGSSTTRCSTSRCSSSRWRSTSRSSGVRAGRGSPASSPRTPPP